MTESPLLRLENMVKYFPVKSGFFSRQSGIVRAVDGVSFSIGKGETFGLVGESGCGKTTVARLITRLEEASSGRLFFEGVDISGLSGSGLKGYWRRVQMVFQDPFESLNPRRTIESTISQPLINFGLCPKSDLRMNVVRLLEMVGLKPGEIYLDRFPHQFSGGQRQRIGIARAIAPDPSLIVADEPVSSLDISVRAQILNLFKELKAKKNFSCLFISHDLGVIRSMCDRVAVMYLGKIVEMGKTEGIFQNPLHPYTEALLSATPIPDPVKARSRKRKIMKGDVPSAVDPPSGCRFRTRCPYQMGVCVQEEPVLREYENGHAAACHKVEHAHKKGGWVQNQRG